MSDFFEAIKRPFTSFKNLTIGAFFHMVPIISIITQFFTYGYSLNAALDKNKKTLPSWTGWDKLFIKGLLAFIIGLIYFIPVFLVIIISGTVALVTSLTNGDLNTIIASASLGVLISVVLGLLTVYLAPVGLLMFARTNKFADAFRLRKVFKKAFTGTWFLSWLLAVIYSLIAGAVGGFVAALLGFTLIGSFIIIGYMQFIILVTTLTILGQAFEEIK